MALSWLNCHAGQECITHRRGLWKQRARPLLISADLRDNAAPSKCTDLLECLVTLFCAALPFMAMASSPPAIFRPAPASSSIAARCGRMRRSEEHTSELQSLMRNSYAVFCLKKNKTHRHTRKHKKK